MNEKKATLKKTARRKRTALPPGLLVSERVQLHDVRLWQYACDQQVEALASSKKQYDVTHSATIRIDKAEGRLCVLPKFHFEAFNENFRDRAIITIDATFLLIYGIENFDGLKQKGYQQFADMNGVYNAWPYWRELVQSTIARMGLPTLVLPVFRIVEPVEPHMKKRK